jgi:saccharopine dehydrogenase-like NADP-dependent oxidoreductase
VHAYIRKYPICAGYRLLMKNENIEPKFINVNKVYPKSYYYYQFVSSLRQENIKLTVIFMKKYTVEKTVR